MIRVLLYLITVVIIGGGFAWLANHPGDVVMTIGNQRIVLPLFIAIGLALIFLIILFFVLWILRAIFSAPKNIVQHFGNQNKQRGYEALSKGMLAALSGDVKSALDNKKRAVKYLGQKNEPLVKMLEAQTYLLDNDTAKAILVFEDMSKNPTTRLAGLHGLYREAIKSGAYEAANQYAEQASQISQSVQWANQAMLDHYSADSAWDKAIALFNQAEKTLPRAERGTKKLNHQRAVLWTGQAMELFENQPEEARKIALKAQKYDSDFVPTTVVAARILYQLHEIRKADKMVEALWRKTPHKDLADIYINTQQPASERLKRARNLAAQNPEQFESCYIIAYTAYDAGELNLAREQVEKAIKISARESAYLLSADIEDAISGDQGLVKQWLSLALRAERDPVWIADGVTFANWAAVSPISGQLDSFEWKVPSRQLALALEDDEILPNTVQPNIVDSDTVKSDTVETDTLKSDRVELVEDIPIEQPEEHQPPKKVDIRHDTKHNTLLEKTAKKIEPAEKPVPKILEPEIIHADKTSSIDAEYQDVPTRINVDDPGVGNKE